MKSGAALLALLLLGPIAILPAQASRPATLSFLADYLRQSNPRKAEMLLLQALKKQDDLDRAAFQRLADAVRVAGRFPRPQEQSFEVTVPGGKRLTVMLHLPEGYNGNKPWPLIVAFGGGPIPKGRRGDRAVRSQARMMRSAWRRSADKASWLVAAVADDVSRSSAGIRYEVVRPCHLEAILKELRRRLNVDEDRTIMSGISLGSNYALQVGAAQPELFAGAAPVATEGEAREPLLRNLRNYPIYVLVGAQDQNIKTIRGPRALHAALTELGYDHVYEEQKDRGHEGFRERYDPVLAWFAQRPRRFWSGEVLRVPHDGIYAPSRSFYWIACDTRQGIVRAKVDKDNNAIDIEACSVARLALLLSDRLLDLDKKVTIRVFGKVMYEGTVSRDARIALDHARTHFDRRQLPAARVVFDVPADLAIGERAQKFRTQMLQITKDRPPLAFWEGYALRHLRETRKQLGIAGTAVKSKRAGRIHFRISQIEDNGPVATSLRKGDEIVALNGNPFFAGDKPAALLRRWLLREQFSGKTIRLSVFRDDETIEVPVGIRGSARRWR